MAEYIEREAAMLTPVLPKQHRQYQTDNLDDAYEKGWEDALSNLRNAPAADVEPVVRCKDCDHLFGTLCAVCGLLPRKPDDFCSYGERKDGADHAAD